MANANVVADSFGGGSGGGPSGSTPPDYYSRVASMRQAPPPAKKGGAGDEVIEALKAVFEVFKKLEAKLGGKPDPNLDAAKDSLKKFVATSMKQDPSVLDGGGAPGGQAPPPAEASAPPPQPGPEAVPGA